MYFDGFIKVVSAALLVYSIIMLKHQVKKMQSPDFFASERLMMVHLAIFVLYIFAYFGWCASSTIRYIERDKLGNSHKEGPYIPICRALVTSTVFMQLLHASSFAMLILFIYLSVKFS